MSVGTKIGAVSALLAIPAVGTAVWFNLDIVPSYTTLKSVEGEGYAKDLKNYFVDPTESKNGYWWAWSYENRWQKDNATKKPKTKFLGITGGWGDGANNLSTVCKNAYNAVSSSYTSSIPGDSEKDKFYEEDVWRYCSIGGSKPKTIEESKDTYSGKYGDTKKAVLISAKNSDNSWFWELKNREFFDFKSNPSTKASESDSKSIFKSLFERKNEYRTDNDTVRSKCLESYEKEQDAENFPKEDVLKFCSLKGQESQ